MIKTHLQKIKYSRIEWNYSKQENQWECRSLKMCNKILEIIQLFYATDYCL